MIDLAFVRANLPLVEEKLRARGADAAVLADFAEIDRTRREAITRLETLKAQRNKLTEEIAQLRRSGADATAQTEQTRELKTEVDTLETSAARIRALTPNRFAEPRGVGRKQLPTTVGALLVHCADHTQRHTGQFVTTAKVVSAPPA